MTDHLFARADEVLTELIELVETARSLPMSTSCVVPRERTLDLLDALRDVLPPEIEQARALVAERDELLAEAQRRADWLSEQAQAEQAQLVSTTTVHQVATAEAADLLAAARAEAAAVRAEAEAYGERLRSDSRGYADRTLSELTATLNRLSATAENGRQALGTGEDTGIS